MQERRDYFVEIFNSLFPVAIEYPSAGLYTFATLAAMGIDTISSQEFCQELIKQEGYVRFAFSCKKEEIYNGLKHLKKGIDRLRRSAS